MMFSNGVWLVAITLEIGLLTRGALAGLFRQHPLFYAYISCVLLKEMTGLLSYTLAPSTYALVYWPSELVTIIASFAVLIEIFRESVRHNPGVVRFGQKFLLIALALTALYASTDFSHHGFTSLYRAIAELNRDLRLVEGALLIVLLWLFVRYRMGLGRNLLGLVIGYSFWIGVNLTDFAYWYAHGNEASIVLRTALPVSYTVTLVVWLVTLWSLQPETPQVNNQIEYDYEFIAAKMRAVLGRTSHRIARALKP